jgi:hypothetical protein
VEKSETNSTVQEQPGIFQLIDQLETAVDKILERQVFFKYFFLFKPFFCHFSDSQSSLFCIKKKICYSGEILNI